MMNPIMEEIKTEMGIMIKIRIRAIADNMIATLTALTGAITHLTTDSHTVKTGLRILMNTHAMETTKA